ncbi:MAG: hypothetical protein BIFFINMI_02027 [Phycisphaerae bacterium]|nr:hypothetical protein [Phycisphaerae bacterium]
MDVDGSYDLAAAGGRLYAVPHGGGSAMHWYEVDPATGKPTEKGSAKCPGICGAVIVSPDGKDLYVKALRGAGLIGFHLGDTGEPAQVASLNGRGLERCVWGLSTRALCVSPDGKFVYGITASPMTIGLLDRKETGEVVYKKTFEQPEGPFAKKYDWVSLVITPDGKWLYASVLGYGKATDNLYVIYNRDPATGELTSREVLEQTTMGCGVKGWNVMFLPDGSGGYWTHCHGLAAFARDAQTGRIKRTGMLKEAPVIAPGTMVWDRENGFLYGGSEKGDALVVVRTEKVPAAK